MSRDAIIYVFKRSLLRLHQTYLSKILYLAIEETEKSVAQLISDWFGEVVKPLVAYV